MSSTLACMLVCCSLAAQPAATEQIPSVGNILDSVLARMPEGPVLITGRLGVTDRGQSILRSYKVEIQLNIAGDSLSGSYTVFDPLGASLERLRVTRTPGQRPRYEYSAGNPLVAAATPYIVSPILDTGVSWSDLSLPFLWWRNGTLVGNASVKGRDCFVIDVRPGAGEVESGQAIVVRVWIDKKYLMLLQAEEYGADSRVLRRLSVQSFKKINDEWMIKDIAVTGSTNLPSGYKSFLTIQDMRSLADSAQGKTPAPAEPHINAISIEE